MEKNILILFIIATIAIGCSKKSITGEERNTVLAYADPIAENILIGYNEGNYITYSKDFDENMKTALPENVFKQTRETILLKIGKYKSRELSDVYKQNQFIIVLYNGKFENENSVEIKVVFQKIGNKNLVSGLWFNSEKLRK